MKKILICLLLSLVLSKISKEYEREPPFDEPEVILEPINDGEPIPDDDIPAYEDGYIVNLQSSDYDEWKCPVGYRKEGYKCIKIYKPHERCPPGKKKNRYGECVSRKDEKDKCGPGKIRIGRKCVIQNRDYLRNLLRYTSSNRP